MSDLTDKDAVKEFLDITHEDWDDLIDSLISRMSAFIESYCGRTFAAADYDERYDGLEENQGLLTLKNYPVNSVADLWDDVNRAFPDSSKIAATEYIVYGPEGIIQLDTNLNLYATRRLMEVGFQVGYHNIRCTHNAGYTTIPLDLESACIELVAAKLNTRKNLGVKTERLGRWGASYGGVDSVSVAGVSVSASVNEVLEKYRNRRIFLV